MEVGGVSYFSWGGGGGTHDWDVFWAVGDGGMGKREGGYRGWFGKWMERHPYIVSLDQPSGDTGGLKAQRRLKNWISACDREHEGCGGMEEKPLTHRLIRIEDHLSGKIRLVEMEGEMGRYACLSHRWCSQTESASLRKNNMEIFKREIPNSLIYPLLKDVIKVVGECGLEYVWIDCMCIIQDDAEDWAQEATKMASIYSNASITISATGCEDGAEGLFRKPSGYPFSRIGSFQKRPIYTQPRHKFPGFDTNLTSSHFPLIRRGWVFQEFSLSKCMIHFTKQELMWSCREVECCECGRGGESSNIEDGAWDWAVNHYMTLDLTYSSDRLPAIGGVAKRVAEKTGNNYLAGLWEENIVFGLLWCRIPKDNLRGRPEGLGAPT